MPRKASQPIRFGEPGAIVEEAQELQLLGPEALALLCPAAPYAMPQTGVLIGKAVLRTSLRGFLVLGFLLVRALAKSANWFGLQRGEEITIEAAREA